MSAFKTTKNTMSWKQMLELRGMSQKEKKHSITVTHYYHPEEKRAYAAIVEIDAKASQINR